MGFRVRSLDYSSYYGENGDNVNYHSIWGQGLGQGGLKKYVENWDKWDSIYLRNLPEIPLTLRTRFQV